MKQGIHKLRSAIEHKVTYRNGRSWDPKRGKLAVNQAALIVALDCNLDKEIQRVLDGEKDL